VPLTGGARAALRRAASYTVPSCGPIASSRVAQSAPPRPTSHQRRSPLQPPPPVLLLAAADLAAAAARAPRACAGRSTTDPLGAAVCPAP
jgi:hypothetical protein